MLIAFFLIGLITLLLFSGLRVGTRAWEAVDSTAEHVAELRVARNFIERALRQSKAVTLTVDAQPYLVFSGNAETLEFVAPLSEHVGVPGLYILRLALEGGERPRVALTRWLLHPDVLAGGEDIPEWAPFDGSRGLSWASADDDQDVASGAFGITILVEGVEEFGISYFGAQEGEALGQAGRLSEADWHEDWLEQKQPPLAVRLHLTTREHSWPDMLIRLPDAQG